MDDDEWPEIGMTIEEDLEDLRRHQDDFINRRAFVYTVVTLDESICMGCVYINPCEIEGYDAEVSLWTRQSEVEKDLEESLYQRVRTWLDEEWPFNRVAFPGREINWPDWRSKLGL